MSSVEGPPVVAGISKVFLGLPADVMTVVTESSSVPFRPADMPLARRL